MQEFKFNYDKENDDLFLYNRKSKSKGSIELGNIILDFNSKKELVGIQIMESSKFINSALEKSLLEIGHLLVNIKNCKVGVRVKNNLLFIKIVLFTEKEKTIVPIIYPNIIKSSPSLSY